MCSHHILGIFIGSIGAKFWKNIIKPGEGQRVSDSKGVWGACCP